MSTDQATPMHVSPTGSPGGVVVSAAEPGGSDVAPISNSQVRTAASWWVGGLSLAAVIASGLQIGTRSHDSGFFVPVLCFLVLLTSAAFDAAYRRIPNLLTYPAILIGLAVNLALAPALSYAEAGTAQIWLAAPGLREGLLGFLLCAFIGVVSFMARGLGGGDVKVLAAVGAMLGLSQTLPVLFNTLVIAAALGVLSWALGGKPVALLQKIAIKILSALGATLGLSKVYRFRASEAPFAVSLLAGLVLAQFVQLHQPLLRLAMEGVPR
jgi:prepilin peptidase CpaA